MSIIINIQLGHVPIIYSVLIWKFLNKELWLGDSSVMLLEKKMIKNFIKRFERAIVLALLFLMGIAVFVATIELGVILFTQLMEPPTLLLNMKEMLEVFGFFLMVLIGLELLETIKAYLESDKIHVEIVFLVAMVAVTRKIIILDYKTISPEVLYGISAIVLSLAAGFFLVKYTLTKFITPNQNKTQNK